MAVHNGSGTVSHSRYRGRRCRRLPVCASLVGAAAVAAAGVVAGRRARDAPGSAAAEGRSARAARRPLLVPGVATPRRRCGARRARPAGRSGRARARAGRAATRRRTRSSSSTTASRSSAPATSTRPTRRSAPRRRPGATRSTRCGPTRSCTRSTSRRRTGSIRVFQPSRSDPLLAARACCSSARATSTRPSGSTAQAARQRPNDDEAQVAAAVGRFDEDNLSASFSRLGPLVKRFPHSQSVRYHLGLLLAWTGQRDQAITEFRLARSLGPRTSAREAGRRVPRAVSCRTGLKASQR